MRWKRTVTMVEAHAEGEVGRVVTGGVPDIPGRTMLEKMAHLNEVDDTLRRFCVFEPRGSAQMSTNLLLAPTRSDADAGFIVLQGDRAHAMSGSNCICVVTVLLETGIVEMREPVTTVRLDTPAGLVVARARCEGGKCVEVSLDMVPSFVTERDAVLDLTHSCAGAERASRVHASIAFGGVFYALVDVGSVNLKIRPEHARRLVALGSEIHRCANEQLDLAHPEHEQLRGISYVMFVGRRDDGALVGATIMPPGRIDRSPCGTGNSARLALMFDRGDIAVGGEFTAHSIIDSKFLVQCVGTATVAGRLGVLARITGRGWIHGIHQIGVDPSDPYPLGFMLSDCWGEASDLVI